MLHGRDRSATDDRHCTKKTWPVISATPKSGQVLGPDNLRGEKLDAFNIAANELIANRTANFQG